VAIFRQPCGDLWAAEQLAVDHQFGQFGGTADDVKVVEGDLPWEFRSLSVGAVLEGYGLVTKSQSCSPPRLLLLATLKDTVERWIFPSKQMRPAFLSNQKGRHSTR
jgi:hypothetical protein